MSVGRSLLLLFVLPIVLAAQPTPACRVELFIGDPEFSTGDGGPALNAKFMGVGGLAAADDGTIYVADYLNYRIRKIDPQGTITTIAGNGVWGISGDGGPAVDARLSMPTRITLALDGSLYFIDDYSQRIRRIDPNGIMDTVYSLRGANIGGLYVASGGVVYFTKSTRPPEPLANAVQALFRLDGGGAKTIVTELGYAGAVSSDSNGDLLVTGIRQILKVDPAGVATIVVGNGTGNFVDGAAPLETGLNFVPTFLATSAAGELYFGAYGNALYVVRNRAVRRLSVGGDESLTASGAGIFLSRDNRVYRLVDDVTIEAVAGVDRSGWFEPGRPLSQSLVGATAKMLTDSQNRLYYFDAGFASVVTRTTLDGKTEIVAGGGNQPADDGVPALNAALGFVGDIALDNQDRLYMSVGIRSGRPSMILRVELNGTLTVLAGEGNMAQPEYFHNLKAIDANFSARVPLIAVTPSGSLFFQVRGRSFKVDADGIIKSAPPGQAGFTAFDREGRLLASTGRLEVYPDPHGPSFQPFSLSTSQGASTSNGTFFALSGAIRVLRRTPEGRTTELLTYGVGIQFEQGKLTSNSSLGALSAIATNKDGDLFIADQALHRVFVIRDADICSMERPYSADVLNGASFTTNLGIKGFAPGELVSVFGDFLGGDTLAYGAPGQSSQGTWQTNVGGLEVLVDDQPAPIIFSRADQAAFVIPNEVSGQMKLRFRRNGLESPTFSYSVKNASPGIFTVNSSGGGQAAALNQDSSINSPSNPAAAGSVIVLYLTGAGATNPPSVTGSLNDFPLPQLVQPVEVLINDVNAAVEFAGPAPGLVSGVVQVNARIPANTPSGAVPVWVKIGGVISPSSPSGQPVTISIQ